MKKIVSLFLLQFPLIVLAWYPPDSLRESESSFSISDDEKEQVSAGEHTGVYRNAVRLNISSFIFKTASLQYERILANKMSVALGVRVKPASGIPFRSSILNMMESDVEDVAVDEDDDDDVVAFIRDAKLSGWAITPEFRYYLGKSAGKGLYLAPFLRYEQFNIRSTYLLTDDMDDVTPIHFRGKMSSVGIGLMLGSQFRLSERFFLDWWILGPYYTSNTLRLSASNLNINEEEQGELRDALNGLDIGWVKISSEVNGDAARAKAKAGFAAVRGFGLCFGFKF